MTDDGTRLEQALREADGDRDRARRSEWQPVERELEHCQRCGRPLAWWTFATAPRTPSQRRATCLCETRYLVNRPPEPPALPNPRHRGKRG